MSHCVRVNAVEEVPADSRVRHVDEFDWPAKAHIAAVDEDDPVAVDEGVAEAFETCDVVKFTEYYEVSVE